VSGFAYLTTLLLGAGYCMLCSLACPVGSRFGLSK
jgi:hypothetical protein